MNNVINGVMGLSFGDALGVPVEFMTREELKRNPVKNMRGYGTYNQPAGTWSDDTSMCLCLVDSLALGLDYQDIMQRFFKWYDEGAYTPYGEAFDIGGTTRKALERFAKGTPPLQCGGSSERDNGNGSLMRILPLVFYIEANYGRDFEEENTVFDLVHNVSALTHAHKRSQIACGIYISVASNLLSSMSLNIAVESGINKAAAYYRNRTDYTDELTFFERLQEKNFADLPEDAIKSSGYVVDTLEAAVWCLLNSGTYKECVLKAVNLGEDTDTVAAVAGGLAGLYYGYDGIPREWLDTLAKREYIEKLCNRLYVSLCQTGINKLCEYIPFFEIPMQKLSLDGGMGSGSGTVVRCALVGSALTGKELHLYNIRALRDKPGLRPQHLVAAQAIRDLCGGHLKGGEVGSRELYFRPGPHLKSGNFCWDIGTAGSATMLALTVLLPACLAPGTVQVQLTGGTFQEYAPTALYLKHVLLPLINRMGPRANLELIQPGYPPAGGGELSLQIVPNPRLQPLQLLEPGNVEAVEGISFSSHLQERQVSARMAAAARKALGYKGYRPHLEEVNDASSLQPGAALLLWAQTSTGCLLGADAVGQPRRTSEQVGRQAARILLRDLASGATVDRFAADQLAMFAAVADGETAYQVPFVSEHLETNLQLVQEIFETRIEFSGNLLRIMGNPS